MLQHLLGICDSQDLAKVGVGYIQCLYIVLSLQNYKSYFTLLCTESHQNDNEQNMGVQYYFVDLFVNLFIFFL